MLLQVLRWYQKTGSHIHFGDLDGEDSMALKYQVGQQFPSLSLIDDRKQEVSITELAGGQPLVLAFYRGPW